MSIKTYIYAKKYTLILLNNQLLNILIIIKLIEKEIKEVIENENI